MPLDGGKLDPWNAEIALSAKSVLGGRDNFDKGGEWTLLTSHYTTEYTFNDLCRNTGLIKGNGASRRYGNIPRSSTHPSLFTSDETALHTPQLHPPGWGTVACTRGRGFRRPEHASCTFACILCSNNNAAATLSARHIPPPPSCACTALSHHGDPCNRCCCFSFISQRLIWVGT